MSPIRRFSQLFTLAAALMLASSSASLAFGPKGGGPPNPHERAERKLDHLTEKLDLSETQQEALRESMGAMGPLIGQSMKLRHELRDLLLFEGESDRTREIHAELQRLGDEIYDQQIRNGETLRATLTAGQLQELRELKEERMERRIDRRRDRHERRRERDDD